MSHYDQDRWSGTGSRHAERRRRRSSPVDRWLLGIVDAVLAAAVFAIPLALGGRTGLGQLTVVCVALAAAIAWCVRQACRAEADWLHSPASALVVLTLLLLVLQVVPLPPPVVEALSPQIGELLPLWSSNAGAGFNQWRTLSLAPSGTQNALILVFSCGLLLLVFLQRVRSVRDVERLLRWISLATVTMSALALVQYVSRTPNFLWFYEYPHMRADQNIQGSFINRNHFAQFVALGLGPLFWCALDAWKSAARRRVLARDHFASGSDPLPIRAGLWAMALAFSLFAGLMSLSRGGAIAMAAAAVVLVAVLARSSLGSRRILLGAAGTGLFVLACLSIFGYEAFADRLQDFTSIARLDGHQGRRSLWKANLEAFCDFPCAGTGLSTHRYVYPIYLRGPAAHGGGNFTHADNSYVQILSETGVPGILLVLAGLGLCTYWCTAALRRTHSDRVTLCVGAVAAGLAASFSHAVVDHIWYVPGCIIGLLCLAACAGRLAGLSRDGSRCEARQTLVPRVVWGAAAFGLAVLAWLPVRHQVDVLAAERPWHEAVTLNRQLAGTTGAERLEKLHAILDSLTEVTYGRPDDSLVERRLAEVHLKLFELPEAADAGAMGVLDARGAIESSGFRSSAEMDAWLRRAFPDRVQHLYAAHAHARRSISLCPLHGEVYLYLAQLSFLEGPQSPGSEGYLKQALRVRPIDSDVLVAAGQEAMLAGDVQAAIGYWQTLFAQGPRQQRRLLNALVGTWPLDALYEMFHPDRSALLVISQISRQRGFADDADRALGDHALAAEKAAKEIAGAEAAAVWCEAAEAHRQLKNAAGQLRCLNLAIGCDSSFYDAHFALGQALLEQKQYAAAGEHLTWCLRRNPDSDQVRKLAEEAADGRLRLADQTDELTTQR